VSIRSATLGLFGAALVTIVVAVWGALALWFTLPAPPGLRAVAALLFAATGATALALLRRQMVAPLLLFAIAFTGVLVWWSTIGPRNDRDWQPDVARLPSAEIAGDLVTLHNVRSFDYRSASEFTERWYDRTVDLRRLDSLDLIAVYWMGDAIAHIMVSFGFGGDHLAISIETRKERGETYSPIAGFFKRYELVYVVGDERDLIRLRTEYRRPEELVYLYKTRARLDTARRLFLEYVDRMNRLKEQPEFYDTLNTNCTTEVWSLARALSGQFPLDWRVLLTGHFPAYAYARGSLDTSMPFERLKSLSLINDKAHAAGPDLDFSALIRAGLPDPPVRSARGPVGPPRLVPPAPGAGQLTALGLQEPLLPTPGE
jgi:hypothetical protein